MQSHLDGVQARWEISMRVGTEKTHSVKLVAGVALGERTLAVDVALDASVVGRTSLVVDSGPGLASLELTGLGARSGVGSNKAEKSNEGNGGKLGDERRRETQMPTFMVG